MNNSFVKKRHFRWISEVSRISTGRDEGKDTLGRGESMCKVSGVAILDQTNPSVARVWRIGSRWSQNGGRVGGGLCTSCSGDWTSEGILAHHHAVRGC